MTDVKRLKKIVSVLEQIERREKASLDRAIHERDERRIDEERLVSALSEHSISDRRLLASVARRLTQASADLKRADSDVETRRAVSQRASVKSQSAQKHYARAFDAREAEAEAAALADVVDAHVGSGRQGRGKLSDL